MGKTIAVNVFIEPPPKLIFNASIARQRMGGINIFDMTPLTSSAWVMDDIVAKPEIMFEGKAIGKASCLHADIEENCREHGINGQLEHNNIAQIISRYDPDEIEARAHGNFMHLSGRIFKTFDRKFHVVPEITIPQEEVSHYMVVDPAIGKPCAIIWAYADKSGVVHIYDEYPDFDFEGAKDSNLTVTDYAEMFKAKEGDRQISTRIIDRHFGNVRRTLGGMTLKEEFAEKGVWFDDSYHVGDNETEVETGILKVKEYLRFDKAKPVNALNCPKLVIGENCRNTILAMDRWSRDPKTYKPSDSFKDFADVVRYLVSANPVYDPGRPWQKSTPAHYMVS